MTAPTVQRVRVAAFNCWGTVEGPCMVRPPTHVRVKLPGGAVLSGPLVSLRPGKDR